MKSKLQFAVIITEKLPNNDIALNPLGDDFCTHNFYFGEIVTIKYSGCTIWGTNDTFSQSLYKYDFELLK